MFSFVTISIGFLDPENGGLAVKIDVPSYLEAQIFQNWSFTAAILEFKNIWANANIDFLIPYTITFPKMYSLANLQKLPTQVDSWTD